jgi:hypothetical protein
MPYEFTQTYERNKQDFYVEPRWAVVALMKSVWFAGAIHDPACGTGTIPKTFAAEGDYTVSGCDKVYRDYGTPGVNFLEDNNEYDNIVTNPPYELSERFIQHALKVSRQRVAILARIAFLSSQRRFKLFTETPPEVVIILSRRPSMPPGNLNLVPSGGKTDYCWIVWKRGFEGPTKLVWSL